MEFTSISFWQKSLKQESDRFNHLSRELSVLQHQGWNSMSLVVSKTDEKAIVELKDVKGPVLYFFSNEGQFPEPDHCRA